MALAVCVQQGLWSQLPYKRACAHASMRDAEELIRSGQVVAVPPKDAGALISEKGFRLLDVRPEWEKQKASVATSIHVPLFIEDEDNSIPTLLKKWIHFGYLGMWVGHKFTKQNEAFVDQVRQSVESTDSKLLVACGEGLRSMLAVDILHSYGFTNLGWIRGGLNNARDGDFEVKGYTKLQFATIGGVAEYGLKIFLFFQGLNNAMQK